jgi:hypothetical protein
LKEYGFNSILALIAIIWIQKASLSKILLWQWKIYPTKKSYELKKVAPNKYDCTQKSPLGCKRANLYI